MKRWFKSGKRRDLITVIFPSGVRYLRFQIFMSDFIFCIFSLKLISVIFSKSTWNLIPRSLKSVLSHDNFHLVLIVAELNFSFPIQTTCVLSKFTFKPEIIEKSCNAFNVSLSEFSDPSKMTDVSAAYCDSLYFL